MSQFFNTNIIFQQLFEVDSSTYTYILGDPKTKEGLIIDPVIETLERDLQLIEDLELSLRYILETHVHADHVTGAGALAKATGALIAMSRDSGAKADILLEDGQRLNVGNLEIQVLSTPGHTSGCISYYIDGAVFTGDALLFRGNGRTDFQQGSSSLLYESIMKKLYSLPDETLVFCAHDYRGLTSSSIGMEKAHNKRIRANTKKEDFIQVMHELKLSLPKKINIAVPRNLVCGRE